MLAALLCACRQEPEHANSAPPKDAAATATAAPSADNRPVIVCFGDSLTAGFGVDPGKSYPDLLQALLDRGGYRYRVVNLGVSGDTTQDGLDRLPLVLAEMPRDVVLEFGANDGLRGQPVANAEANLAQMIEALKKQGITAVLAGITLPPNYGPDYITKFNTMYSDLAKKYKLALIPFLLQGAAGHDDLMQRDGLHPNTEGTRLVADNVARVLEPLLEKK
ncbi:MAG TPA: arylesterase [Bryobacteraceae bacterium]|nr:arylesterase [Bryobacteraceae bacterium]